MAMIAHQEYEFPTKTPIDIMDIMDILDNMDIMDIVESLIFTNPSSYPPCNFSSHLAHGYLQDLASGAFPI